MIRHQATNEILFCKELGINIILLRGSLHRKIAIVDRSILWEGSLNMLSHYNSQEIMRRLNRIFHRRKISYLFKIKEPERKYKGKRCRFDLQISYEFPEAFLV